MIEQLSVFLENKSGRLAELTRVLGDATLNGDWDGLAMANAEPSMDTWGAALFAFVAHEFTVEYAEYTVARS